MLLTLWAALTTLAFGSFILGHLLGFHGVASVGAVMLIIVGGDVILNDVQVKTGEQVTNEHKLFNETQSESDTTVVQNSTTVNYTYETHSWTEENLGRNAIDLGLFQILIGLLLFYQQMLAIGEGQ